MFFLYVLVLLKYVKEFVHADSFDDLLHELIRLRNAGSFDDLQITPVVTIYLNNNIQTGEFAYEKLQHMIITMCAEGASAPVSVFLIGALNIDFMTVRVSCSGW